MTRAFAVPIAALSVAALGLTGCSSIPQTPPPVPDFVPVLEPSTPAEVGYISDDGFSRAERTALRVRTLSCEAYGTGSAWVLDEDTAVTNLHVIEDAVEVEVTSYDGRTYTVTSMEVSRVADLALVHIDGTFPEAAVIASEPPEMGDTVTVAGFPEGVQLTVTTGRLGATIDDSLDLNEDDVYAFSAASKEGNSGSAVVNEAGEVVGVLYAGNEAGTSYAVTLETLKEFLANEDARKATDYTCPWL